MASRPWRLLTLCASLAVAEVLPARASGGVKKVPEGAGKPPVSGNVSGDHRAKSLGLGPGAIKDPSLDLPDLPQLPAPIEGLAPDRKVLNLAAPTPAGAVPKLTGQETVTAPESLGVPRAQGGGADKGQTVLETLETLDQSVGRSLEGSGPGLSGKRLSDQAYDEGGPKVGVLAQDSLIPGAGPADAAAEASKAAEARRLRHNQEKARAEERLLKSLLGSAKRLQIEAEELEAKGRRAKAEKKRERAQRALMAAEELKELFRTDPKTGVLNRYAMWLLAGDYLQRLRKPAVAFLDMNNLGAINRGLIKFLQSVFDGRLKGDETLIHAGQRLKEIAKENGVLVGRFGGEEFAVAGELENVLAFIRQVQLEFKGDTVRLKGQTLDFRRGQILKDAGLGEVELSLIERALAEREREGQEVGNFTFGVALADPILLERASGGELEADAVFEEARGRADAKLTLAKLDNLRGLAVMEGYTPEEGYQVLPAPESPPGYEAPRRTPPKQGRLSDKISRIGEFLSEKERRLLDQWGFKDELTGARAAAYVDAKRGAWGERHRASRAVLLMIRGLKLINDFLTHAQGDRILRRLVAFMEEEIRRENGAGSLEDPLRWGQNEFGFLGSPEAVRRVLSRVLERYSAMLQNGEILTREELLRIHRKLAAREDEESKRQLAEFMRIGEIFQAGKDMVKDVKGMANVHETFRDASLRLYEAEESGSSLGWGEVSPMDFVLSPMPRRRAPGRR